MNKIITGAEEAIEYAKLRNFVIESNRIEGINRQPTHNEVVAHKHFLSLKELNVPDIAAFVAAVQADAVLRDKPGLNVRVANHIAPPGGPGIRAALEGLCGLALTEHPYKLHRDYETLHPFTDGNGRSGRAIWLWMMANREELPRALSLGFLHYWYYQSLDDSR